MKTGKRLWSLLLALVMVASLMGGAFVTSAADTVAVTPTATYGGAALTMTATGVADKFTLFDLASIGYGTAKEYAFWFDADGTFSFDQDVALSFQGQPKADLKAGEVYGINGYSECYVTLDDGNMIALIDSSAPGNFASLAADKDYSEFPGTIAMPGAAAPAEEAPAEEAPAEEAPAAEEPAAEEPAAEGEGFVKTDALEVGKQYVFVAEYDGKYYAMTYIGGTFSAIEVEVAQDAVVPAEIGYVWVLQDDNQLESCASAGIFLFPYSGGMTYTSGRHLLYDGSAIYFITSDGTPGYVTFDGASFNYVKGDADAAAKMLLFTGEFAAAGAEAEQGDLPTIFDYTPPETVRRSAVRNDDGSVTLAFTSDIHYDGKNLNLKTWLEAAEADVGYIDAFGSCGDMGSAYASGPEDFWTWTGAIMDYMDTQIAAGKVGDAIYTTGNHEWFTSAGGDYGREYFKGTYPATKRLRPLGEGIVTDAYIIYCFGAGESTGYQGTLGSYKYLQNEIDAFAEWLKTAPTDIPIFVLTHYPLHKWGGRGEERMQGNAAEIIDIMNEHPNLVVLWGHNHSNYDANYYDPLFPGDEMVIDANNNTKKINFTYFAAGCTADIEYTGPSAGSASVMNKGLIVTINADGTLDFKYYTIDGEVMPIESPWLVRFRGAFGDYEVFNTQYVEDGKTAEAVAAPEVEGYAFDGWYTWIGIDGVASEVEFDFSAPITKNTLVTAKYSKILMPAAAPAAADCVTVTPAATRNGEALTMTAAGVGDLITVFDLSSIGYGTAIMYGFWFDADGVVSFNQDVTLLYQGNTTDFTLKAGEFYSTEGFGEHYIQLDDGKSDLLLLEYEAPGNYASLPGDQPFSAFPGTVTAGGAEEPEPEPEPADDGQTYYTVQEGDSLRSIAKAYYGTIFKWRLIYEANYDSMSGVDMIYPGQVLLIP
jgi:nucleoid-associated protein YgaU